MTDHVLRALRGFVAAAITVALAAQFAIGSGRPGFNPVNFFSYFTVLSNVAVIALLAAEAIRPAPVHRPQFAPTRGAVTLYMWVTGIVYAVLLTPEAAEWG